MMSDHSDLQSLQRSLSALGELEPPPGTWSRIEERLAAPRPRRGPTAGLALGLAGLVALALVLFSGRREAPGPETAPPMVQPAAVRDVGHDALARRSDELEQLLASLPARHATRASTGLTTALLEDRIAAVDERLSLAPHATVPAGATDALWRERVVLLDTLVRVRYAAAVDPVP